MRWDQGLDMWDYSSGNRLIRVVQERDLLVGVVGTPQFGLLRLPRETSASPARATARSASETSRFAWSRGTGPDS
jgi:hypothetical protein